MNGPYQGGYHLNEYIRLANAATLQFDEGDKFAGMTLPERILYIVDAYKLMKELKDSCSESEDLMYRDLSRTLNENYGLKSQIAALIDNQNVLEAKIKNLQEQIEKLDAHNELILDSNEVQFNVIEQLNDEVQELTKKLQNNS